MRPFSPNNFLSCEEIIEKYSEIEMVVLSADARIKDVIIEKNIEIKILSSASDARINAAEANALMAKQNTDTRINEADAYALRAKQAVATAIRAERAVTAHNLQEMKKQN